MYCHGWVSFTRDNKLSRPDVGDLDSVLRSLEHDTSHGNSKPGQGSRCLSNSRCSKSELLKAVPRSAEQGKLVFFCLRSHAIRHQVFFFSLKYLSFSKSIIRNFFLNLRSISFIELTSQYSGSDYPRFRSISIWNLNMVWIHKKKFSCVVWWGLSGLWSEESDVIRKKVNCSPAY